MDVFIRAISMVVAATMFGLVWTPASAQETPESIDQKVLEAIDFLKKSDLKDPKQLIDGNFDDLIRQLVRLRAARGGVVAEIEIIGLPARLLDKDFGGADSAKAWPDKTVAAIAAAGLYFDGLLALRDPIPLFLDRAAAVRALVAKVDKDDSAVQAGIRSLVAAVTALMPTLGADRALAAQAELATQLKAAGVDKVLLANPEAVARLAKLRTDLAVFTDRRDNRVHVIGALYGDINAIMQVLDRHEPIRNARHHRWCVASAALSTSCERQRLCRVDADFETALCGFDPAPFMASAYKGLVVLYECLPNGDDAVWYDRLEDAATPLNQVRRPTLRTTMLYSKQQSFSCAPPIGG